MVSSFFGSSAIFASSSFGPSSFFGSSSVLSPSTSFSSAFASSDTATAPPSAAASISVTSSEAFPERLANSSGMLQWAGINLLTSLPSSRFFLIVLFRTNSLLMANDLRESSRQIILVSVTLYPNMSTNAVRHASPNARPACPNKFTSRIVLFCRIISASVAAPSLSILFFSRSSSTTVLFFTSPSISSCTSTLSRSTDLRCTSRITVLLARARPSSFEYSRCFIRYMVLPERSRMS